MNKYFIITYSVNFVQKKLLVQADNVLNAKKTFVMYMKKKNTKNYFIAKVEWIEYAEE